MNLFTKQKQTHRHTKKTHGYQRGKGWGGRNWEMGIDTYTLLILRIKWTTMGTYCIAQGTLPNALW